MPDLGLELPPGTRLVSLAERPDLEDPLGDHNVGAWPAFMLKAPVANRLWHHLAEDFPAYQLALIDEADAILAGHNSAPVPWDGTDDGLPEGWDDQFERSARMLTSGDAPGALGALQIVVQAERRGTGLAELMLGAMRANAIANGLGAVIACVRPTIKPLYPLMPIERYAAWTRDDGLPFDPWMRLHARAGGRIVRASPESMTYRYAIDEWETWTGLSFPESGPYVVAGACQPVEIDLDAGIGVYHDPNVWVVHDLR